MVYCSTNGQFIEAGQISVIGHFNKTAPRPSKIYMNKH